MMEALLSFFALLVIPVANWQRWILPNVPNYHLQHLLFYVCAPALLCAWWRGAWSPAGAWERARPLLPWAGLVLLVQAGAFWVSAARFTADGQGIWTSVLFSLAKLCMQLPFIFFFMEIGHVLMRERALRRNLVLGALASFAVLLVLCAMQGTYIYALGFRLSDAASLARYGNVLKAVAAVFESRWIGGVYDFYANGTYALTLLRINGFFEEASSLAAILAVFYVPLGFGLLRLGSSQGNSRWVRRTGIAVVLCSCIVMVLARTSTGLWLAFVAMVLLAAVFAGGRPGGVVRSRWLAGTGAVALSVAVLGVVAVSVPGISGYLVQRLDYRNVEQLSRVVVAREMLLLVAEHPLIGVGRGWASPYVLESEAFRQAAEKNKELRTWRQQGKLVILSVLPEALAEYGIPLVLVGIALLGRLWLRLRRLRERYPQSPEFAFASAACGTWCIMFLAATPGSHDIRNPLISLPFFLFVAIAGGPLRTKVVDG